MSEKTTVNHSETNNELDVQIDTEIERDDGAVQLTIDVNAKGDGSVSNFKLAKDGCTILIPQPSDDPADPMNWTSFKKHYILLCVAFGAFAGDFGASVGFPPIVLQGTEWNMSPVKVNYANNLTVIMAGISGILWMPLLNCWGRMPVFFWTTFLGFLFSLGATLSPNFTIFYGLRALQSVFQTTGQTAGLVFVEDMFFFHEQARKIGILYCIFISSPFFGPCLGNFIIAGLGQWRACFWLITAWSAALLVMILLYGDETYYDRMRPVEQPHRGSGHLDRLLRITGVWQIQNHAGYFPHVLSSYRRLLEVFLKPIMPMAMLFYSMVFMWSIGINVSSPILLQTPTSAGGYGFSANAVGLIYFSPIVAVFAGEAFGHFFNDYLADRYTRQHHGVFVIETRLWTNYIAIILMIPGLVLVGETLQNHLHWVGIVFGWGMFQFGVMLVSVATVAYVLNCYPRASGEVSALINFGRVATGFSVGYFQQEWGFKQGFSISFGLQAVIIVCAYILLICLQVFGGRLRHWAGPVSVII
ncbi:hypothetical protein B7463_g10390, partial [Scytalidium lignicola]